MRKQQKTKSLIRIQYAITYVDSSIRNPLGMIDPLIHTFESDGNIVALPKSFYLRMKLEAVEVRKDKKSRKPLKVTPILFTGDIMDGGEMFHRPYTKDDIKKMRDEASEEQAKYEKELEDYDE